MSDDIPEQTRRELGWRLRSVLEHMRKEDFFIDTVDYARFSEIFRELKAGRGDVEQINHELMAFLAKIRASTAALKVAEEVRPLTESVLVLPSTDEPTTIEPPRGAEYLLNFLPISAEERLDLVFDFEEDYAWWLVRYGKEGADRLYRYHVLLSWWPLFKRWCLGLAAVAWLVRRMGG